MPATPCIAIHPVTAHRVDLQAMNRLLGQALALPDSRVDDWLAGLPDTTRHLVPRLQQLLQLHRTGGCDSFLAGRPRLNDGGADCLFQPGHRVGPYRLLRPLGRGGLCSVWLADRADAGVNEGRGTGRHRPVAIKLPHRMPCAETHRRMAHERDITALMRHPRLARLRGAGLDSKQRPYLVLDWVDGLPLDRWCQQHQPSLPNRLRLALQLARALAHVHRLGVVHRDLKPANVLVSKTGQVHLLDFGIACRQAPEQLTGTGPRAEVSGTPAYASPEQRLGEQCTLASDVYSLGVVVFELLTGQLPHPAPQSLATGRGWLTRPAATAPQPAPPLASRCANDAASAVLLRGAADAVLCQALAPLPAQRPMDADAFGRALRRVLQAWRRGRSGRLVPSDLT